MYWPSLFLGRGCPRLWRVSNNQYCRETRRSWFRLGYPAVSGMASPADLAGMAFPAVVGVTSAAELAGMVLPAVAGVTPMAELAGMVFPAVVGAASLAVVEVASSTDLMEPAGSPSVSGSQSDYDCLIPDYFVTVPDMVVFQENIELRDPTVVVSPVVRDGMSITEGRHRD